MNGETARAGDTWEQVKAWRDEAGRLGAAGDSIGAALCDSLASRMAHRLTALDAYTPTLHEALAAAGYASRPHGEPGSGRREVYRVADGETIGVMRASSAWDWLHEQQKGSAT